MKILVLSDTHGNIKDMQKLYPLMKNCDYIFHLGDNFKDIRQFADEFDKKIYAVLGNCDGGGDEYVADFDGHKFMLVHGDRYHVKSSLMYLQYRAEELGVEAVFFGHSHRALVTRENGILYVNPGTLTRYANKSYAIVECDKGQLVANIVELV